MAEFNLSQRKRKIRQGVMAGLFVLLLISGWVWPFLGYFIPLGIFLGIGIGVCGGRKWCDWLCPCGSFFDSLIQAVSPKARMPDLLKNTTFRITLFLLLGLIFTSNIIARWPNSYRIGKFFLDMLTVTTILGIILALFFHQRSWCYLCPLGSFVSWIGGRRRPLKINSSLCRECQLCSQTCPMQILLPADNRDCLKCELCISLCPSNALSR